MHMLCPLLHLCLCSALVLSRVDIPPALGCICRLYEFQDGDMYFVRTDPQDRWGSTGGGQYGREARCAKGRNSCSKERLA